MTQNALSIDVMALLAANALGTVGTNLFAMEWGDKVDAQTLILDTGGIPSDLKDSYEQPTFQILVRGNRNADANIAYQSIRAVHDFLIAQPSTINLLQFEPNSGPPTLLGRDENDRMTYSCNYYTYRNPT